MMADGRRWQMLHWEREINQWQASAAITITLTRARLLGRDAVSQRQEVGDWI